MIGRLSRNILAKISLWGTLAYICINSINVLIAEEVHVCKWDSSDSIETSQKFDVNADWGHIFCGDVNRRKNKATGYHSRPKGLDSPTAYVGDIKRMNKITGVYEASPVYVWYDGDWLMKHRGSSFFPDHCDALQVMGSIAYASMHISCRFKNGKWGGPSGPKEGGKAFCFAKNGTALAINGYFRKDTGNIVTAWPLLKNIQPESCQK